MSFEEERGKRANMKGPDHGIHPKANGEGKGQKTVLREAHCKPGPMAHDTSVPRVFV